MDAILPYIWLVIGCGWRQTVCFKKMWPNSRGYSEILTTVWRLNFVFKIKSSIRIYKALPVWHWWLGLFHYFNRILFNTTIQTNAYSYFKESAPIPQVFFFFFRSSSKPSMGRWYVICWEQLALNRKKTNNNNLYICRDFHIQVKITVHRFCIAWENSLHLATPSLVSPRNDVWELSAEIPYWWRLTTQT